MPYFSQTTFYMCSQFSQHACFKNNSYKKSAATATLFEVFEL
jgi:hypothetical protein